MTNNPYRLPAEPVPLGSWRDRAACQGADQELFFAEGSHGGEAKAICRICPVRAECLEYALVNDERFGVWGGLTPKAFPAHEVRIRVAAVGRQEEVK